MAQTGWKRRRSKIGSLGRGVGENGAVQVEFALTILTILFVMFWMWEMIMVVYTLNVLSDAAKEGVRYAIVRGGNTGGVATPGPSGPGNTTAIENRVKDYAKFSLHDITAIAVSVTYPDGSNVAPSRVRVEVAYNFIPYTALPVTPLLRAAAEGRIVY